MERDIKNPFAPYVKHVNVSGYLLHTTFVTTLSIFNKIKISLSNFDFFYRKITYRYSKIGFLRKWFNKEQKPAGWFFLKFVHKTIALNNYSALTETIRLAKFEIKITVHYSYGKQNPVVTPWYLQSIRFRYPTGGQVYSFTFLAFEPWGENMVQ